MGKAIPIRLVEKRRNHLKFGSMNESNYYPLYKTYNSIYNYENIKDSIHNWTSYSSSMGSNMNKLIELYSMVIDKGNLSQLQEITNFLKEEVSYIESPYVLKKQLSSISEDNEYVQDVLTSIVENTECDRLIKNYNAISKRFNVEKFIKNDIVHEDSIIDGIYGLCSLIDTYNMDIPSRFCIAAEMALYTTDKIMGNEIPKSTILENVIDYYLVNYGTNDFDRFYDIMKKSCSKDLFIQEDGIQYLDYLKNIHDNFIINEDGSYGFTNEDTKLDDSSTFYLDLMLEYTNTESPRTVYYTPLVEFSFTDTVKNIVSKIKLAPVKGVALFKEGIRAIFVTTRLQDIARGTKNALAMCFYGFIILAALSFSIVAGLLTLIVALIISKCVDKEYLKSAIKEWKEHKYSVERKIRECNDPEKKRKLEAYLSKVEDCIAKLEEKYEKMRDKTANEIDSSSRMNDRLNSNSIKTSIKDKMTFSNTKLIDPQGNEVDISGNNPSNNNPSSDNNKSKPYVPENSTENDDLAEYERYMREREAEKHKR